MVVPTTPVSLMWNVYRKVIPAVHLRLNKWRHLALKIPNQELRKQALASIATKTFHCEGGAIYSLLTPEKYEQNIDFIVAYQTISDYLDNLCDRSTSLDPTDFRMLHEAMIDALTPGALHQSYYQYREEQDDGGYLDELVSECQHFLEKHPHYEQIKEQLYQLAQVYVDLQVHKHVKVDERVPRLSTWFQQYEQQLPTMTWYEFSASSGSTLGVFCLISSGHQEIFTKQDAKNITDAYFPWMQGIHILLDYLIDQEEDRIGGDLNFCFYYESNDLMFQRFQTFFTEANESIQQLPNSDFHQMILRGLLGIYLSDTKVVSQQTVKPFAKSLIRYGGEQAAFFYVNGKWFRKIGKQLGRS